MKAATRIPFCGSCDEGWICDPETGLPLHRCPCRTGSAVDARTTAIETVELAKLSQNEAARRIIRDVAAEHPVFSSNQTSELMRLAGIDVKSVAGAAYTHALRRGWIEWTGQIEQSTDPAIRHPVKRWRSLDPKFGTS